MAKNYEIRVINGRKVFIKNIVDNFWLFNDVYADLCDDFKVTDSVINDFLQMKDEPIFPYGGAENGKILVQGHSKTGYYLAESCLSNCSTEIIRKKAEDAYHEYKSWAGI